MVSEISPVMMKNYIVCILFLQAPSQIELENWIRAIHSACASLFARQHGKDNTLKLLKSEIQRLETNIDMVSIVN